MSIRDEENKLFSELKKENPDIVTDGIIDETSYLDSKYKIVYVLKEVNGGKGWSLTDFVRNGGRSQTWDNIARWTEAILNIDKEKDWDYYSKNNAERRRTILRHIGVINLKKTSGSYTSDNKEIYQSAVNNESIIRRQIELYKPDIIICGGTGDAFVDSCLGHEEVIWERTSRGVYYVKIKNFVVISFAHPEARVGANILHYALIDAVREILKISVQGKSEYEN